MSAVIFLAWILLWHAGIAVSNRIAPGASQDCSKNFTLSRDRNVAAIDINTTTPFCFIAPVTPIATCHLNGAAVTSSPPAVVFNEPNVMINDWTAVNLDNRNLNQLQCELSVPANRDTYYANFYSLTPAALQLFGVELFYNENATVNTVCRNRNQRPGFRGSAVWTNFTGGVAGGGDTLIFTATRELAGQYTCSVPTVPEIMPFVYDIVVQYSPEITTLSRSEDIVNDGDTLTLDCSFVGFPTPNITWTLNNSVAFLAESGVSVDTSQSGSGSTSRLTFTNVTPATALGNYSCFVSNVVGNTSRNFTVLVALPEKVANVQVFLFSPLDDASMDTRNAFIIWNHVARSISSYNVTIFDSRAGMNLSLLQTEHDVKASYVPLIEVGSFPTFPTFVDGQSYHVQVTAFNESGVGPTSDVVSFTMSQTGQNFPMQVLSLNSSGTSYFGSNTEINQQLSVGRDAGPIVVDAIDRKAIWYERNLNLLNIQSLGIGGNVQTLLVMPADIRLVSMTYDWIAKEVYVSRVIMATGQFELIRVSIFDPNSHQRVFPNLQLTVRGGAFVNSAINPAIGLFYWSISDGTGTTMYEVSLNDSSLTSLTPARIMRNSQTRRKRQTSGFTTALAVDPIIDELLISDDTLGDILLCMRNFSDCTVYVNRSVLETNSMRANVGLPAGSIKFGGQFIYWMSTDSSTFPGVFAVDRSDRRTLIVIDEMATPMFIAPLSPDQQPLPEIHCLAPFPLLPANRLQLIPGMHTSTELTLFVQNAPTTRSYCDTTRSPRISYDGVFAPFVFTLTYGMTLRDREVFVTRKRKIVLTDLKPHTEYFIDVIASNKYSFRADVTSSVTFSTTEGDDLEARISAPRIFSDCSESEQIRSAINRDVVEYLQNQFGVEPLGKLPEFPAASCTAVEQAHRQPSSGLYWITQGGSMPIQVFCDF